MTQTIFGRLFIDHGHSTINICIKSFWEQGNYLFGAGIGRDIPIFRFFFHQQIPDTTANQIAGKTVLGQSFIDT